MSIVDDRNHRTVIGQITEDFIHSNGPHGWARLRITVEVIFRKEVRFVNEHEIIIKSEEGICESTKNEFTFLEQLKKIVNCSRSLEKELGYIFLEART